MRVPRYVPPSRAAEFVECVAARNYLAALGVLDRKHYIPTLRSIWRNVPRTYQAPTLAIVISAAETLYPNIWFLYKNLIAIHARGERVFDDGGRKMFEALPATVTLYRGTTQLEMDEGGSLGVSWTLDRKKAVWFAKRFPYPNIFRPIILTMTVKRDDICGCLADRKESEVLIIPKYSAIRLEPLRKAVAGRPRRRDEARQG